MISNDFGSDLEQSDLIIYSKMDSFTCFNSEKCLEIPENSRKIIFNLRLDWISIGTGNLMCSVLSAICFMCYVPIEELENGFAHNF